MTLYEKYRLRAAAAFRRRELAAMSDEELLALINDRFNALPADAMRPLDYMAHDAGAGGVAERSISPVSEASNRRCREREATAP